MKKLTGWQRVWIVCGAFSLVLTVIFVAMAMENKHKPTVQSVLHDITWEMYKDKVVKKFYTVGEMSDEAAVKTLKNIDSEHPKYGAKGLLELLPDMVWEWKKDVLSLVLKAVGSWAIAGTVLYLVGWSIAWIRRGFKGESHG